MACLECKKFIPTYSLDNIRFQNAKLFFEQHKHHTIFLTNEEDMEGYTRGTELLNERDLEKLLTS
jgi:hypothetical protein